MKTQAETDEEILDSASVGNNIMDEVRVRHTSSVHPIDCHCIVCKPLQHLGAIAENKENVLKEKLDLFDETKL